MEKKTGFFRKFFTSIYDINVFSKYAKEGIMRAILYATLMVLILGSLESAIDLYDLNKDILEISSELESKTYSMDIQDGILEIREPYIFEDGGSLVYFNQDTSVAHKDQLRDLFIHKDIYALFLKDGIIINNSLNEYKINYSSIFRSGIPIYDQINTIKTMIICTLFIFNILIIFFDFIINCLIVAIAAGIIALLMKMMVKYSALYSLTIYAATLPFILQIIFEIISPNINFDMIFIAGTLTYLILILKYIKAEIIENIKQGKLKN